LAAERTQQWSICIGAPFVHLPPLGYKQKQQKKKKQQQSLVFYRPEVGRAYKRPSAAFR